MAAIVNLRTKKIYGCKEGSLSWRHEVGHLVFHESELATRLNLYQGYIIYGLFVAFFAEIKIFQFILILALLFIDMFEEIWCWIYAFKKRNDEVKKTMQKMQQAV